MDKRTAPVITTNLRGHMIEVPEVIRKATGIVILGKRIKSLIFSTDVAVIKNTNADAVMSVYPFTPQPIITQSLINASDVPVFCGVGGGTTTGKRVINLALDAEFKGAIGVVLNSPTKNEILSGVRDVIDI
ncbi:MAG: hydrolase, partial [Proteiniclasticum sp.]|nr:hydrolase [Proteiniclasticum sp.]